jgi:hypothetical protein
MSGVGGAGGGNINMGLHVLVIVLSTPFSPSPTIHPPGTNT